MKLMLHKSSHETTLVLFTRNSFGICLCTSNSRLKKNLGLLIQWNRPAFKDYTNRYKEIDIVPNNIGD